MAVGVVPQRRNVFALIYLRMRGPVLLTLPTSLRELGDCSTHFGLLCCFFRRVCVAGSYLMIHWSILVLPSQMFPTTLETCYATSGAIMEF